MKIQNKTFLPAEKKILFLYCWVTFLVKYNTDKILVGLDDHLWKEFKPEDPSFYEFKVAGQTILEDQIDLVKLILKSDFIDLSTLNIDLGEIIAVGKIKTTFYLFVVITY